MVRSRSSKNVEQFLSAVLKLVFTAMIVANRPRRQARARSFRLLPPRHTTEPDSPLRLQQAVSGRARRLEPSR